MTQQTDHPTAFPATTRKPRWPFIAIGVLVLAVAVLAAALFWPSDSETAPTAPAGVTGSAAPALVTGKISLPLGGFRFTEGGGTCNGTDGYSDVAVGASVTVTDAAGTVIGVDTIGWSATVSAPGSDQIIACELHFAVSVPAGKGFYGVEVTHRGVTRHAESDIGHVDLQLG